VTTLPPVDLTVYPFDCDAFGHLNQAACLALLERARWDALAKGPGMDLFKRNGMWPAVRRVTVDYRASAFPGDVLRVETAATDRGTTSFTLRHSAKRLSDGEVICEADLVFVCIDRAGRPMPVPEEVSRLLGLSRGGREARRLNVAGIELAVDVRGEGPPVLFVHGFPFDRTMWRHQLAALTKWKRIAPDLRGAGASTAPAGGYSMARYADDLVALLDALGERQVVVCGLSMGGYIVFELLRRHADRVRAVILADTKAEADTAAAKLGRDQLAGVAEREGADAVIEKLLPKLLSPATVGAQPEVVEQVREMGRRWPVVGLVGAIRSLRDRPDSTPLLPGVKVPALVVVGAEDEITPAAGMKALAQAIPGSRYAEIPAAGHVAPLEQPLATTRAIADFLESLR